MRADREAGPLAVGQMLDDKYRIDELLEVGGMGAVYVGSHTKLQKRVAIKVLRTELVSAVEIVERFLREAVAASRIGHENIIEVTDIGKAQNGSPFIVMELLEGENLAARIKRVGPLPVPQACHIAIEILSAMDAAHRAGIVHRDLKPENVFLVRKSRAETVKVLDFGISRMVQTEEGQNRLTLTGLVMGTPYYMSPEQAVGESEITAAADLYASGVILYEMLTAKVPFEATNYNSLIYKVLSGQFPPPRVFVPMPGSLEQIIFRAMQLKPQDRFGSAVEMIHALEPFAPPVTTSQPFPLVGYSPSPAGGFQPAVSGGVPLAPLPGLTGPTARVGSPQEVYAPTVADSGPFESGQVAKAAVPKVMTRPPDEEPRRRSRGIIVAVAAVAVLGGAGAGVLALQSARDEQAGGAARPAAGASAPAEPAAVEPSPPAASAPAASAPAREQAAPAATDTGDAKASSQAAATPADDVTLSFVVTPADAEIRVGGVVVAEHRFTAPRSSPRVVVEVSRDGYVTKKREVSFESDREIEIILQRSGRSRRPARQQGRPAKESKSPGEKRIITDSPYD
jgi:serine/threonine protein kinase